MRRRLGLARAQHVVLALLLLACSKGRQSTEREARGAEAVEPGSAGEAPRAQQGAQARSPDAESQTAPARPTAPLEPAPADVAAHPLAAHELLLEFEREDWGRLPVLVQVPARSAARERYPVLVTFHGRGESLKGPARGVRGWLDDYALGRAIERLREPPLSRRDFEGMVTSGRLDLINQHLAQQSVRPLIVVMPYLPDVLKREEAFTNAPALARFVTEAVLPQVYERTPALGTARTTGIDGVSLGGRASLLIGLTAPGAFAAVGALQAAVDEGEIERFAQLAEAALQQNPALRLRLLTSTSDYYLEVNRKLARRIGELGGTSELLVVDGTHGYAFNRGPGAIEMLLFHDRALWSAVP